MHASAYSAEPPGGLSASEVQGPDPPLASCGPAPPAHPLTTMATIAAMKSLMSVAPWVIKHAQNCNAGIYTDSDIRKCK